MPKPLNRWTGPNLVDMGRVAVHAPEVRGDSDAGYGRRLGGHEEGLRRTRGDAAGAKLGTSPIDRLRGERGN
ncbi:MAG: hypothetical protein ACRD12_13305, partial [Acidimicrobiales bacterium]